MGEKEYFKVVLTLETHIRNKVGKLGGGKKSSFQFGTHLPKLFPVGSSETNLLLLRDAGKKEGRKELIYCLGHKGKGEPLEMWISVKKK